VTVCAAKEETEKEEGPGEVGGEEGQFTIWN